VTLAAAVVSVAIGLFVAWRAPERWPFVLIPVWMFLRMAFNAIDGMLAREFAQKSRLGAYLNEITDVVSDSFLYLPFALIAPFSPLWTGAVIVLAVISEYAGVLGLMVGASRRYDGPMGKSDRAFIFGALGLWIALTPSLPQWAGYVMPILVVALCATIVNRVRRGLAENTP
jgi:CDP-diacylglycerol--glycerol-3-phosphate 3-phosphatidyltransferase